ncbi:MAG: DUF1858 domain-containing protein [Eubacterium sp.]|nr:DUF1858 domain-containing protein [Eubacterium sp.]
MGARAENGKSEAIPVTPDTTIHDILEYGEDVAEVLAKLGLHCTGCPSAVSETLEQACTVHNINLDDTLAAINEYIKQRDKTNDN